MRRISDVLAMNLKQLGVKHTFGIPGKAVVPVLLELDRQGIPFNLARHECGAGYIASGYSLMNQTLGVAIGTSGPGGTNLLTAAAQAKAWHLPVLFITGQPSAKAIGKPFGQDSTSFGTDLVRMFDPVTKFSARVNRAESFQNYFTHAIEKALHGVKGPVHLSIPMDVLLEEIEPFVLQPKEAPHMVATKDALHHALSSIQDAKRPVMILGKGVHASHAYEEVIQFAEAFNIPVMTTPGGKGTFPTTHELSLDGFGLGGSDRAADYLTQKSDLVIVIGSKLSDMSIVGLDPSRYPQTIIHFDYDHTFIGKSILAETHHILGDAASNIKNLLDLWDGEKSRIQPRFLLETNEESSSTERMLSKDIILTLRETLPSETVFFGDDGSHSFYAIKHLSLPVPGTFYFDDVFGAMGHAIGYSIGAKVSKPEKSIVCLAGDGCFFMHGNEISTAVDLGAATLFVIFNNGRLDMVDKGMSKNVGKAVGTRFKQELDVQKFSEAMGANAYRCWTLEELKKAIKDGLNHHDGPTVIEVMVDQEEIPPTLQRG
ncbi:thiamine pyrophosphate-binding protein [Fictibacillus phosphorivorans]|uniref:thiamine pyrophosphate-binding protein n=1 Tax=Fictibacillus phosphorivorans TaxID=1221500 RepID=UPI00129311A1|nr:thiamine pyrophosphate-binding protein [Fictibacillus phosphorivorans]MQR94306.1 thiamine pyrophosphate-binding protein [Fictibacillus phosphorivorans]